LAARGLTRWLAGALAFALLSAWQAALLHPLEHHDTHGGFVHLGGADGSDARGENQRPDGPFEPTDLLGDSLAAAAACVAQGLKPSFVPRGGDSTVGFIAAAEPRGSPPRFYRSQAPPSLH
jgi:hypothetical protein